MPKPKRLELEDTDEDPHRLTQEALRDTLNERSGVDEAVTVIQALLASYRSETSQLPGGGAAASDSSGNDSGRCDRIFADDDVGTILLRLNYNNYGEVN